ncbi:hypothetical protein [uncultured Tenacibaculum sp.]|uniref:hypothetical protein n=1 Tax=uncultured Tenacibaculum sp. TaxID=174713 RepID=UPI00263138E9|nr:hypothetical protein [uncultured Tenacibaculum sp.]
MKKFIFLTVLVFLNSCNITDDCDDSIVIYCPNSFQLSFALLDKDTDENLLTNGTISLDDLKIINNADNSEIELFRVDSNDSFAFSNFIPDSQDINYSVLLSSDKIFDITAEATKETTSGCCDTVINITNIKLEGVVTEIDNTDTYKVFI